MMCAKYCEFASGLLVSSKRAAGAGSRVAATSAYWHVQGLYSGAVSPAFFAHKVTNLNYI